VRSEGQVGNGSPVCNPVCELHNSWYGAPLRGTCHLSIHASQLSLAVQGEGEKRSDINTPAIDIHVTSSSHVYSWAQLLLAGHPSYP